MKFFKKGIVEAEGVGKKISHEYHAKAKKRVGLALFVLIAALIVFTGYFLFFYEKPCDSIDCFVDAMKNCKPVSWIREDAQASWLYTIKGHTQGDACEIQVKLLEVKQGTIASEKLEGKNMICIQQRGDSKFPEKDISSCTGRLKEEMQDLIIQNMHSYLLENVGEIQQGFQEF